MSLAQELFEKREPYAGGLLEFPDREPIYRFVNAQKRMWEMADLTPYDGGRLYPCGKDMAYSAENADMAMRPEFGYNYSWDWDKLRAKSPEACEILLAEHNRVVRFEENPYKVG